uniref:Translation initiation factor 1 n=1 Tax=Achlys triphylla TaxID=63345 RepID=A0A4D6E6H9_ACHTR|nr:translation initiation factor 1 [Achlys triphylla]
MKEQKWIHHALITESFPNGMFRVRLDNKDVIFQEGYDIILYERAIVEVRSKSL